MKAAFLRALIWAVVLLVFDLVFLALLGAIAMEADSMRIAKAIAEYHESPSAETRRAMLEASGEGYRKGMNLLIGSLAVAGLATVAGGVWIVRDFRRRRDGLTGK